MTGYTRADSVNNIADGNIINASDLDGEFDAVQAAFNSTTGHVHDGTAANGAPITKIGPTQDVVASAIALLPKTTATVDVGSSSLKFKDFFFSGAGSVTGTITAGGFSGPLNGTVGATTPAAGTFTSLTDSGNLTFTGTGNRITGDFSNATVANRVTFQTSTTNGNTIVPFIPNGSATQTNLILYNSSDVTTNFSLFTIRHNATASSFASSIGGTGTYVPITFETGGSERMRLDTSGNVGIGTASPSQKLDVVNTANSGISIRVNSTNAGSSTYGSLIFGNDADSSVSYIQQNSSTNTTLGGGNSLNVFSKAGAMTFSTASTERMRIDSSGNVGIGQTSPQAKLQINTAADGAQIIVVGAQTANEQTLLFRNSYYTNNATGGIAAIGWIDSGSSGGSLTFKTGANGGGVTNIPSERMRIDQAGNVGIGTSSPTANNRLTLSDTNSSKLTLTGGSAQNGMLFNVVSTSNQYYIGAGNNLLAGGDKGFLIYDATNARAKFFVEDTAGETRTLATTFLSYYTGASERMRIDSSGNVNIGSAATTAAAGGRVFDIYNLENTNSSSYALTRLITYNVAGTTTVSADIFKNKAGSFVFNNNETNAAANTSFGIGGSERMRIDSSGNVLVTNPAGLGYGTGSGGTVTQATSKSTSVTLNKPTGQITMNAAALAAGTSVFFDVNDSLVAATDNILLTLSNFSALNYTIKCFVSTGKFTVILKNETAGSLSEAVVFNFGVLKGATA